MTDELSSQTEPSAQNDDQSSQTELSALISQQLTHGLSTQAEQSAQNEPMTRNMKNPLLEEMKQNDRMEGQQRPLRKLCRTVESSKAEVGDAIFRQADKHNRTNEPRRRL